MSLISVHSLALFNISKAISNRSEVGVLLGKKNGDSYVVETTFELLTSQGQIDMAFYDKRLQQHLTVSPTLEKIGIYVIDNTSEFGEKSSMFATTLKASVVLMVSSSVSQTNTAEFIKGYVNGAMRKTMIESDEIEGISLSTIAKFNKYYGDDAQTDIFSVHDSKTGVLNSINQLSIKLQGIIDYCDMNHTNNIERAVEVNNLIGQLTKKLRVLKSKGPVGADIDHIISNELALLTKAFAVLDKYKVQTSTRSLLATHRASSRDV